MTIRSASSLNEPSADYSTLRDRTRKYKECSRAIALPPSLHLFTLVLPNNMPYKSFAVAGAGGLGSFIVKALADKGVDVVVLSRSNEVKVPAGVKVIVSVLNARLQ